LRLTLVFVEDCMDGLLAGDVTYCEVEQLPCRSWFAVPELVDECFVGRARDERSDRVCIHDVGESPSLVLDN
jgi:hypothetical protein